MGVDHFTETAHDCRTLAAQAVMRQEIVDAIGVSDTLHRRFNFRVLLGLFNPPLTWLVLHKFSQVCALCD
ncbi:MAG: hypothetical protein U0350_00640 [Caldilineaceae bacterium]